MIQTSSRCVSTSQSTSLPNLGPRYTKPGLQAVKNNELTIIQKEYSDDRLSGYTVSSLKAVRRRYILFVFMVSSVFFPPAIRA